MFVFATRRKGKVAMIEPYYGSLSDRQGLCGAFPRLAHDVIIVEIVSADEERHAGQHPHQRKMDESTETHERRRYGDERRQEEHQDLQYLRYFAPLGCKGHFGRD
jgi:hypothetical protein